MEDSLLIGKTMSARILIRASQIIFFASLLNANVSFAESQAYTNGVAAMALNDLQKAIYQFDQAVTNDATDWNSFLKRGQCLYQLGELLIMLGVFFVIFSFITKRMNDGVFLAWLKFTKWWAVLALLAVAFASSSHDAFFPYFEKRPISFFVLIVYVVVSTVILVYKSNQLRKK